MFTSWSLHRPVIYVTVPNDCVLSLSDTNVSTFIVAAAIEQILFSIDKHNNLYYNRQNNSLAVEFVTCL